MAPWDLLAPSKALPDGYRAAFGQGAKWVWADSDAVQASARPTQAVLLRRALDMPTKVQSGITITPPTAALLYVVAIGPVDVILNSEKFATVAGGGWQGGSSTLPPVSLVVRPGRNIIKLLCNSGLRAGGTAAAGVAAVLVDADTGAVLAQTDSTWCVGRGPHVVCAAAYRFVQHERL
jgi:hypothetical protein